MKKFLLSTVLAACTIVGAQFIGTSSAFAADYWCGTNSEGNQLYLVTESVRGGSDWVNCNVKFVDDDGNLVYTKHYEFSSKGTRWYYFVGNHGVYVAPGSLMYHVLIAAQEYDD